MGKRILWLDDEPYIGLTMRIELLRDAGYEVQLSVSVDDAMDWLARKEEKFDLLIMDIMMPLGAQFTEHQSSYNSSGLTLARRLRSQGLNTPIIVVTGLPDAELRREFEQVVGVAGYFTKPIIRQADFAAAISSVIGRP